MAHMLLVVIILVLQYSALASPKAASHRNLVQFSNMINYKGYSSGDYNGYGCWCGAGSYGTLVFDGTDNCCRIHDQCYDRISGGFFGCSPKLVTYKWEQRPNKAIVCADLTGTCDRNACECDKAAVDCYARHRSTYDRSYLKAGNSEICN